MFINKIILYLAGAEIIFVSSIINISPESISDKLI